MDPNARTVKRTICRGKPPRSQQPRGETAHLPPARKSFVRPRSDTVRPRRCHDHERPPATSGRFNVCVSPTPPPTKCDDLTVMVVSSGANKPRGKRTFPPMRRRPEHVSSRPLVTRRYPLSSMQDVEPVPAGPEVGLGGSSRAAEAPPATTQPVEINQPPLKDRRA